MMKVLIAEDSTEVRKRLVRLVESVDGVSEILEAGDIAHILESLQQNRPDLLILDVRLPDGNAIDILQQPAYLSHRPVTVVVTSFPYPQYRERSLALGADYFLDKSLEFEKIRGVVASAVGAEQEPKKM